MALKTHDNTEPYVQLLVMSRTSKGVRGCKVHAGVGLCVPASGNT